MEIALEDLTVELLSTTSIWSYIPSKDGRLWVKPSNARRVRTIKPSQLLTCPFTTPQGQIIHGLLEGMSLDAPVFSHHWKKAHLLRNDGAWFDLARYHDYDWEDSGPVACAAFFGLSVAAMFPLYYNLESISSRSSELLSGNIEADPSNRMTRSAIIAMAVPA